MRRGFGASGCEQRHPLQIFFRRSLHTRVISLHWRGLALGGVRQAALQDVAKRYISSEARVWVLSVRLKLLRNMGGPDRTPCGECGDLLDRDIPLPDIRVARGLAKAGGSGRYWGLFSVD